MTKQISVSELVPYARNAKTHPEWQIKKIASSVKEFGFLSPVVTDGENGILAGHGRVLAAQLLGLDTVPCVEAAHLTKTQRKAFILADNKLAESPFDDDMLRLEFEELAELDFDLELTGFSPDEIATVNMEIEGVEDVDHFNENFNFSISCKDLTELALVQNALGATGKKINADRLLEALK